MRTEASVAEALRAVASINLANGVWAKLCTLPADDAEQAEEAYADHERRRIEVDTSGLRLYLDGELWLEMTREQLLATPQPDPPMHTGN